MSAAGNAQGSAPPVPVWPVWLWLAFAGGMAVTLPAVLAPSAFHRLLRPLGRLHQDWIGKRIDMLADALARFKARPGSLAGAFAGAVFVQAVYVGHYVAVVRALRIPVTLSDLAVLVPLSLVVQLLPV